MSDIVDNPEDELPSMAGDVAEAYPEVWNQYTELGRSVSAAGPIEGETKRLVKLALAAGAQSEGAVHSHVRRALDEGVSPEMLRHVALLAIPTIGFPQAVAVLSWIEDLTES